MPKDRMSLARSFARQASPHAWLLVAENLHQQALHLQNERRGHATWTQTTDEFSDSWDATNRPVFLLGGFALENALKAFLVFENPGWVSNGTLARPLRSHWLTELARMAQSVPNKRRYNWVLREFEEGLDGWARYPCGLTAETSADETLMDDELWDGYLRLMSSYGRRLRKLLSMPWAGPHGVFEQWEFEGELWLGAIIGNKILQASDRN